MRQHECFRPSCILTSFRLSDDCLNQISNPRITPEPGDFSSRLSGNDNSVRRALSPVGSGGASIPTAGLSRYWSATPTFSYRGLSILTSPRFGILIAGCSKSAFNWPKPNLFHQAGRAASRRFGRCLSPIYTPVFSYTLKSCAPSSSH